MGFRCDSLESRFALQKLLDEVAGRPEQHAVNYAVLRSMMRAIYSPQDEGHYALASECYCHFTSPIRRYPDLTVHRLLDAVIFGRKPPNVYDDLVVLGQHCSDREQRAETAERELTKLKLLSYLSTRIGEEMDAIVTGVENYGLFVQGVKLPAEGLLPVDSLTDDYYHLDRGTHTLSGRRGATPSGWATSCAWPSRGRSRSAATGLPPRPAQERPHPAGRQGHQDPAGEERREGTSEREAEIAAGSQTAVAHGRIAAATCERKMPRNVARRWAELTGGCRRPVTWPYRSHPHRARCSV